MTTIAANLQAVHDRIAAAAQNAGRQPSTIALLAVTKTWSAEKVLEAYRCGQRAFGENYLQEASGKIAAVRSALGGSGAAEIEWHFIGPIQSNKTRPIAELFDWVHTIEREKIAARLNDARPAQLPPLNVLIEVNVSGEESKSGIAPGAELQLAQAISRLPRLKLRGLMAIPEPTADVALQRQRFARLRGMLDQLNAAGFKLDTLSMGMSDDLEAAVLEGATIVRIGTAIFGARQTTKP
jgi:pyridoxal phosphate enzyme (YggS family)